MYQKQVEKRVGFCVMYVVMILRSHLIKYPVVVIGVLIALDVRCAMIQIAITVSKTHVRPIPKPIIGPPKITYLLEKFLDVVIKNTGLIVRNVDMILKSLTLVYQEDSGVLIAWIKQNEKYLNG